MNRIGQNGQIYEYWINGCRGYCRRIPVRYGNAGEALTMNEKTGTFVYGVIAVFIALFILAQINKISQE